MYLDVSELRDFYYQTRLGRSVQRRVQVAVRAAADDHKGDVMVGFGFASPFLRPFRDRFKNVVNLMPEKQGVMAWPPGERNVTAMCPAYSWPLSAGSADLIVLAHGIERCDSLEQILRETWRVLAPEGRAVFVVPNRLGIWASSEATPFGVGRPFSFAQIERLLKESGFDVECVEGALYAPPSQSKLGQKSEKLLEWALSGSSRRLFAGALVLRATKHIGARPPKLRHNAPVFASPKLKPAVQRK